MPDGGFGGRFDESQGALGEADVGENVGVLCTKERVGGDIVGLVCSLFAEAEHRVGIGEVSPVEQLPASMPAASARMLSTFARSPGASE